MTEAGARIAEINGSIYLMPCNIAKFKAAAAFGGHLLKVTEVVLSSARRGLTAAEAKEIINAQNKSADHYLNNRLNAADRMKGVGR